MDSRRTYSYLVPSLFLTASLILSACQESSQQYSPRVAKGGEKGRNELVAGRSKLTKEQERYVIDPTSLPPYVQNLKPLFDNLNEKALAPWSSLFKLKKWILAPMDLKKEEANSVSITYASSGAEALARQTQYEVWMDSRALSGKENVEQADIILNEFLTSLYTLKNLSDDQLCALVKELSPKTDCKLAKSLAENSEQEKTKVAVRGKNNKTVPSETVAIARAISLKQGDYNSIRLVKNYILQEGAKLQHEDLVRKMMEHGFDTRIFSIQIRQEEELSSSGKISGEALESLFAQAASLGKEKRGCHLLNLGLDGVCELSAQRTEEQLPDGEARRFLKMTIKEEGASEALLSETVYQLKEIKAATYKDASSQEEIYLVPLTSVGLSSRVVGAVFHMSYMVAVKNGSSLQLEGLLLLPGVVSKTNHDEAKNKTLCEGVITEAKDKSRDAVFVAGSNKYLPLIKEVLKSAKAVPPCW